MLFYVWCNLWICWTAFIVEKCRINVVVGFPFANKTCSNKMGVDWCLSCLSTSCPVGLVSVGLVSCRLCCPSASYPATFEVQRVAATILLILYLQVGLHSCSVSRCVIDRHTVPVQARVSNSSLTIQASLNSSGCEMSVVKERPEVARRGPFKTEGDLTKLLYYFAVGTRNKLQS